MLAGPTRGPRLRVPGTSHGTHGCTPGCSPDVSTSGGESLILYSPRLWNPQGCFLSVGVGVGGHPEMTPRCHPQMSGDGATQTAVFNGDSTLEHVITQEGHDETELPHIPIHLTCSEHPFGSVSAPLVLGI